MKHLKSLFVILAAVLCGAANAQSVDTVAVWSASMKKNIKNVVITPAAYQTDKDTRFLGGIPAARSRWRLFQLDQESGPFLPELASPLRHDHRLPGRQHAQLVLGCSGRDSTSRYETYMTRELLPYIDKNYRTIASREGRAITGLSMGGQGGFLPGVPPSGPLRSLRPR